MSFIKPHPTIYISLKSADKKMSDKRKSSKQQKILVQFINNNKLG